MKPAPDQPSSHRDPSHANGPSVEDHGRVVTANRRAAAFYRQAQRAADRRQATAALRLAVHADPTFGVAMADLCAITGTAGDGPSGQQMNWERHHIEVVRTAASGDAGRATDLLCEHIASVGCDPLAVRIAAQLQPVGAPDEDFQDLVRRLPGCHRSPSATHLSCR